MVMTGCVELFRLFEQLGRCRLQDRPEYRDLYPRAIRDVKIRLLRADLLPTVALRKIRIKDIEVSCVDEYKSNSALGCDSNISSASHQVSIANTKTTDGVKSPLGTKRVPVECVAYIDGFERVSRCPLLTAETRSAFASAALAMKGSFKVEQGSGMERSITDTCVLGLKVLRETHPGC